MKKILFLAAILFSLNSLGQSIIQPDRVVVRESLRPPQDTIMPPLFLGELRSRVADSSLYLAISFTGKKWVRSSGSGGADGNNYPTGLTFNQANDTLTLFILGLPSLRTAIPRTIYDGSETKIAAGTGGVIITGTGTTVSPYSISVPTYNGSETKLSAGSRISITGQGTIAQPYLITATDTDSSRYTTILRTMQKIDSLGAVASIRSVISGDTSLNVINGTGPIVDVRSRDSSVDVVFISSDGSILFEYWGSGDNVDTFDLRTAGGVGGGDNWGTQTVVKDTTLIGEGTTLSPLGINPNAIPGLSTYYTANGRFLSDRDVDLDGRFTRYLDTVAGVSSIFRISHAGILVDKSNAPPLFDLQDSTFSLQTGNAGVSSTTRRLNLSALDSIVVNARVTNGSTYIPVQSLYQLTTKQYVDSLAGTKNGSETKLSAGTNITITGLGTIASPYVINSTAAGGGNPGTVTSVGLSMPAAFVVSGSPITSNGTFTVTANGTISQYIRGDGTLAAFPAIPTYDGSETKLSAGPGVGISGAGTIASPYIISNLASGSVTSIGMSVPAGLSVSPGTITTSGTFNITTTLNGLVIGTGSGLSTASVTAPMSFSAGVLSMTQASGSNNGWITSANFLNWEAKQQPLQFLDEGATNGALGVVRNINFVGPGVTSTLTTANTLTVNIPGGAGADGNNYPLALTTTGGLITVTRSGLSAISDSLTTTRVLEGSNQYFTNARARSAISAGVGLSYNSGTGVMSGFSAANLLRGNGIVFETIGSGFSQITKIGADSSIIGSLSLPFTGDIYTGLTMRVGYGPGLSNTNTAVGFEALNARTSGIENTAIGSRALRAITTGTVNLGIGRFAGQNLQTGIHNIMLNQAMTNVTNANRNIAIGYATLQSANNSEGNVVIGHMAYRYRHLSGTPSVNNLNYSKNSVVIGDSIYAHADSSNNQILIGYGVMGMGNNTAVIGRGLTATYLRGTINNDSLAGVGNRVLYASPSGAVLAIPQSTAGNRFLRDDLTWAEPATGVGADGNNFPSSVSTANGLITIGRTGLSAIFDSLSTGRVVEGANLYFTNARARSAFTLNTAGNSGAATYNSGTGAWNIPNYTLAGLGGEPVITASFLTRRYWNAYKQFVELNSDSLTEGSTNLFYTNTRARAAISLTSSLGATPSYNSGTGQITVPTYTLSFLGGEPVITAPFLTRRYWTGYKTWGTLNTDSLNEGTNQFFTNARARSAISVSGLPLTYNSGTGVVGINQANGSQSGFITAANFTAWEAKHPGIQFRDEGAAAGSLAGITNIDFTGAGITATAVGSTLTVNVPNAGGGADGNNYPLSVSTNTTPGLIIITRDGIAAISDSLTTTRVTEGSRLYFTDARARAAISLTSSLGATPAYNSGTGQITVPTYTLAHLGGEPIITAPFLARRYWTGYKTWGTLNTDSLNEGSTNLFYTNTRARAAFTLGTAGNSGPATYNSGTGAWNIPNYTLAGLGGEPAITAPFLTRRYWNGYKQYVQLNSDSLNEGSTNLFFTNARARTAISAGTGIGYNSGTGVVSNTGVLSVSNGVGNGATSFPLVNNVGQNPIILNLQEQTGIDLIPLANDALGIMVLENTTTQRAEYRAQGALVGTRKSLNFNAGTNTTWQVTDDLANDRVNVQVNVPTTTIVGNNGVTVTGSYPNFTVSGPGGQAFESATTNLSQATFWAFAYDITQGYPIQKAMRVGSGQASSIITINTVMYVPSTNFTTGQWVRAGTISDLSFRPNNTVITALPLRTTATDFENSVGTNFVGSSVITGGQVRIQANGNVDVWVDGVTSYATLSGSPILVVPIHVTYFYISGS